MIEFRGLTKRFGDLTAVDGLEFTMRDGEVFGLLGPNGAGKTTTMKLLLGLLKPTSGTAVVAGYDVVEATIKVRGMVGYLPEQPFAYDYLNAVDFLRFVAEVRQIPPGIARERIERWLGFFGLAERQSEYLVNYSQGMKKKVALAAALIHDPPVLIMDEPTGGLDPKSVRDLREKIMELAAEGKTILLSTHVLEVAQKICNRIGIIARGKLAALGAPGEICSARGAGADDLEQVFIDLTAAEDPSGDFRDPESGESPEEIDAPEELEDR